MMIPFRTNILCPLGTFLLVLQGCVIAPEAPVVKTGHEDKLTCVQLRSELEESEKKLAQINKEIRPQLGYLPPSGPFSVFNVANAKKKAEDRIQYLKNISEGKKCYLGPNISGFVQDGGFGITFDQTKLIKANQAYKRTYHPNLHAMPYRRKPIFRFLGASSALKTSLGFTD